MADKEPQQSAAVTKKEEETTVVQKDDELKYIEPVTEKEEGDDDDDALPGTTAKKEGSPADDDDGEIYTIESDDPAMVVAKQPLPSQDDQDSEIVTITDIMPPIDDLVNMHKRTRHRLKNATTAAALDDATCYQRRRFCADRGPMLEREIAVKCQLDAVALNIKSPDLGPDNLLDAVLAVARQGIVTANGWSELEFVSHACSSFARTAETFTTVVDISLEECEKWRAAMVSVGRACTTAKRAFVGRKLKTTVLSAEDAATAASEDVATAASEDAVSAASKDVVTAVVLPDSTTTKRILGVCERTALAATVAIKVIRGTTIDFDFASCIQPCDDAVCVAAHAVIELFGTDCVEISSASKAVVAYVQLRYSTNLCSRAEQQPCSLLCESVPDAALGLTRTVAKMTRLFGNKLSVIVETTPEAHAKACAEAHATACSVGHAKEQCGASIPRHPDERRIDDIIKRTSELRLNVGRAETFCGDIETLIELRDVRLYSAKLCASKCALSFAQDYPTLVEMCVHHSDLKDVLRIMHAVSACISAMRDGSSDSISVSASVSSRTAAALLAASVGDRLCWGSYGPKTCDFVREAYDASVLLSLRRDSSVTISDRKEDSALAWVVSVEATARRAVELLEECASLTTAADDLHKECAAWAAIEPVLVAESALLRALEVLVDNSVHISNGSGRGLWSLGRESDMCRAVTNAVVSVARTLSKYSIDHQKHQQKDVTSPPADCECAEDYRLCSSVWKSHFDARWFAVFDHAYYGDDGSNNKIADPRNDDGRVKYWRTIHRDILGGWWWPVRGNSCAVAPVRDSHGVQRSTGGYPLAWLRYAVLCLRGSARLVTHAATTRAREIACGGIIKLGVRMQRGCSCDVSDAVTLTVALAAVTHIASCEQNSASVVGATIQTFLSANAISRAFSERQLTDDEDEATLLARRACCFLAVEASAAAAIMADARIVSTSSTFRHNADRKQRRMTRRLPLDNNADDDEDSAERFTWKWFCVGASYEKDADEVTLEVERAEAESYAAARAECCEWSDARTDDFERREGRDPIGMACDMAISCIDAFRKTVVLQLACAFDEVACAIMLCVKSLTAAMLGCKFQDTENKLLAFREESPMCARAYQATSAGPTTILAIGAALGKGKMEGCAQLAVTWLCAECGWTSVATACGTGERLATQVASLAARFDHSRGYLRRRRDKEAEMKISEKARIASEAATPRGISFTSIFGNLASRFSYSAPKPAPQIPNYHDSSTVGVGEDLESGSEPETVGPPGTTTTQPGARAIRSAFVFAMNLSDVALVCDPELSSIFRKGERRSFEFSVEWIAHPEAVAVVSAFCQSIAAGRNAGTVLAAIKTMIASYSKQHTDDPLIVPTTTALGLHILRTSKRRRSGTVAARSQPIFDAEVAEIMAAAAKCIICMTTPDFEMRKVAFSGLRVLSFVIVRDFLLPMRQTRVGAIESLWFVPSPCLAASNREIAQKAAAASAELARRQQQPIIITMNHQESIPDVPIIAVEFLDTASHSCIWEAVYGTGIVRCSGIDDRKFCLDDEYDRQTKSEDAPKTPQFLRPIPFGYDFEIRTLVNIVEKKFIVARKDVLTIRDDVAHPTELYRVCECLAYAARAVADPQVAATIGRIIRCAYAKCASALAQRVTPKPAASSKKQQSSREANEEEEDAVAEEEEEKDEGLRMSMQATREFEMVVWMFYAEAVECQARVVQIANEPHMPHGGRPLHRISECCRRVLKAYTSGRIDRTRLNRVTWLTLSMAGCISCFLVGVMVEAISLAARAHALKQRLQLVDDELTNSVVETSTDLEHIVGLNEVVALIDPASATAAALHVCAMAFAPESTLGMVPVQMEIRKEIRLQTRFSPELKISLQRLASAVILPHKDSIPNHGELLNRIKIWADDTFGTNNNSDKRQPAVSPRERQPAATTTTAPANVPHSNL